MPARDWELSPVVDRCRKFVLDEVLGKIPLRDETDMGNCAGAVAGP